MAAAQLGVVLRHIRNLAGEMRLIARLIKADAGTRVFYARQSGYDTHAAQAGTHATLLEELGVR